MRRGDRNLHRLQGRHDRIAGGFAAIVRREIEVRAHVAGRRRFAVVGAFVEEKELGFEADAQTVQRRRAFERTPQRRARTAFERFAVGHRDVANQSRFAPVGRRPRVDRERRRVGTQKHVEFLAAHEPVDRSAVEGYPAVERVLEFADGNRDVLAHAEDIGEHQTHEAHVLLAREFHDVAFRRRAPVVTRSGVHR